MRIVLRKFGLFQDVIAVIFKIAEQDSILPLVHVLQKTVLVEVVDVAGGLMVHLWMRLSLPVYLRLRLLELIFIQLPAGLAHVDFERLLAPYKHGVVEAGITLAG